MQTPASNAARGICWMVCSAGVFSLMSVLVRLADQSYGVNAWQTAAFRFIISIVLVIGLSIWLGKPLRFVNIPWLISRGLFGGAAVCIYFYSITHIGLAKAAILFYSYPLWAGLLAPVLLKERFRASLLAAVLASLIGLYLIMVPPQGLGAVSWLDVLALSGGLLSGWAILSISKLHATDSSRAILFSQCFFGLLLVAVPAARAPWTLSAMACTLLAGVGLCAAVAQLQMTYAYKFIGATEGSLLSMLTPVMNVVLELVLFREPVSLRTIIGCGIVLASCLFAMLPQGHRCGTPA